MVFPSRLVSNVRGPVAAFRSKNFTSVVFVSVVQYFFFVNLAVFL